MEAELSYEPQPSCFTDTAGPELCVVVPTFNERDNVVPLIRELSEALDGISWEVIFVDDDSTDGTAQTVRRVGAESARVRCIQRIGRRGLSTACTEGMLGSTAPYLAVMDGDLQHDPKILPVMLRLLKSTDAELVVGSRYVEGGSTGQWSEGRLFISRVATRMGYRLVPAGLRDPMSGFFMLHRPLLEEVVRDLSGLGFKILLDILATSRRTIRFREVPYGFRERQAGASKLDSQVASEYLMLLADKLVGRYVPVRFLVFSAIGGIGVLVHLSVVGALLHAARLGFVADQAIGTGVTIVFNYSLNNVLTYRDKRRRGLRWFTGLVSFFAVCSVGAAANVGVAAFLFDRQREWMVAALGGVLIGAVWNYAVSSTYTWSSPRRS